MEHRLEWYCSVSQRFVDVYPTVCCVGGEDTESNYIKASLWSLSNIGVIIFKMWGLSEDDIFWLHQMWRSRRCSPCRTVRNDGAGSRRSLIWTEDGKCTLPCHTQAPHRPCTASLRCSARFALMSDSDEEIKVRIKVTLVLHLIHYCPLFHVFVSLRLNLMLLLFSVPLASDFAFIFTIQFVKNVTLQFSSSQGSASYVLSVLIKGQQDEREEIWFFRLEKEKVCGHQTILEEEQFPFSISATCLQCSTNKVMLHMAVIHFPPQLPVESI